MENRKSKSRGINHIKKFELHLISDHLNKDKDYVDQLRIRYWYNPSGRQAVVNRQLKELHSHFSSLAPTQNHTQSHTQGHSQGHTQDHSTVAPYAPYAPPLAKVQVPIPGPVHAPPAIIDMLPHPPPVSVPIVKSHNQGNTTQPMDTQYYKLPQTYYNAILGIINEVGLTDLCDIDTNIETLNIPTSGTSLDTVNTPTPRDQPVSDPKSVSTGESMDTVVPSVSNDEPMDTEVAPSTPNTPDSLSSLLDSPGDESPNTPESVEYSPDPDYPHTPGRIVPSPPNTTDNEAHSVGTEYPYHPPSAAPSPPHSPASVVPSPPPTPGRVEPSVSTGGKPGTSRGRKAISRNPHHAQYEKVKGKINKKLTCKNKEATAILKAKKINPKIKPTAEVQGKARPTPPVTPPPLITIDDSPVPTPNRYDAPTRSPLVVVRAPSPAIIEVIR